MVHSFVTWKSVKNKKTKVGIYFAYKKMEHALITLKLKCLIEWYDIITQKMLKTQIYIFFIVVRKFDDFFYFSFKVVYI